MPIWSACLSAWPIFTSPSAPPWGDGSWVPPGSGGSCLSSSSSWAAARTGTSATASTARSARRVGLIDRRGGPRYGPPDRSSEGGYAPLGLPRPSLGRAPAQPWRASRLTQDVSSVLLAPRELRARGHVGRDAGAGGHARLLADDDARHDDGAGAEERAGLHAQVAAHDHARREVGVVADPAIVLHHHAAVEDRVLADDDLGAHGDLREDDGAGADACRGGHGGRRVHEARRHDAEVAQSGKERRAAPPGGVADAGDGAVELPRGHQPRPGVGGPPYALSGDGRAGSADEAGHSPAARERNVGDGTRVGARAEDEQPPLSHLSSPARGRNARPAR